MTVHDDIDNLLAANLHGELSDTERQELQSHLLDCAICRQAFQETKIMNQLLEEKLEKPDPAFEQRVLANFRERVPEKGRNILQLIVDLMRLRSAQITAVAAVLLALVQVGRLVTKTSEGERVIVAGSNIPQEEADNAAPSAQTTTERAEAERVIVGGGNIPTRDEASLSSVPKEGPASEADNDASFSESLKPAPASAQRALAKSEAYGGRVTGGMAEDRGQLTIAPEDKQQDAISQFGVGQGSSTASLAKKNADQPALPAPPPAGEAAAPQAAAIDQRKLIRNARVEFEIANFGDAVEKITSFAKENHGYIATSGSQKQSNGKLRGEVVVKVLPDHLDLFLQQVRELGELKNQTLGTDDVTKQYFDTDARLKNAHVMEQRLIDMLEKNTGKVSDLLQVEKELGRVREEIEKMQGELKYWDSQVQFATVTISLAEKDMEEPAAFLLQEYAQLSLFAADVEKSYDDIRSLASPKVQITNARLDRDNSGRVVAHLGMLIVPEESEAIIARVKETGRIDNFQDQTSRVTQGGNGLSENAKTKRDKVQLNVTITREIEEQPVQETSLRILTSAVDQNAAQLKDEAAKAGAEVRNSTFTRDPGGREVANISLRIAMKNYAALMKSLNQIGEVKDVSVQRHDKVDKNVPEENAPANLSIQIYSQGHIVSADIGIFATLRNTIGQSAGAIMWSVRMIGVAVAFLAPWVIALVAVIWIAKRIVRARRKL